MEGEGGLHWHSNKSAPLNNTLDSNQTPAFKELRRRRDGCALRALHF